VPLTKLEGFVQPKTLKETAKLLHQYQDKAIVIGGGTFIHGLVARGLVTEVEYLIDLGKLGLDQITIDNKTVSFGASVNFDAIESNTEIAGSALLGAISDAVTYPPPQIKHAATIGGCVAASCPFLDLPVSLLALDATATAQGRLFKRKIPFKDLFVSLFGSSLKVDEFITGITLPQMSVPTASAFQKLETNANDLAILNVALRVSLQNGKCASSRVFIGGGVGETPYRSHDVEAMLDGSPLTRELIDKAAASARQNFEPLSDHRASCEYRQAMAEVLTKRCLEQVAERLGIAVETRG
jgi:xanthine dehydrogenase small subunit